MTISIEMGALSRDGRCRLKFVIEGYDTFADSSRLRGALTSPHMGCRTGCATSWMEELLRPATIRAVVATEPRRERVIGLFVTPKAMGEGEH